MDRPSSASTWIVISAEREWDALIGSVRMTRAIYSNSPRFDVLLVESVSVDGVRSVFVLIALELINEQQ